MGNPSTKARDVTENRLSPPPPTFAATRDAAHRLAVYVISPARRRATGRIGLRAGEGGFTTPTFGDDERVSLEVDRLVRVRAGARETAPVTTLNACAQFVLGGPPDVAGAAGFDVPPAGDPDARLPLDPAAARALGHWFGFAFDVLGALRADLADDDPSEIQLWPEHFDAAFDVAAGDGRATFGASPGDATSAEPYLYVLPPGPAPRDDTWNATDFTGAALPLSGFVREDDQAGAALAFLRGRRAAIT